MDVELNDSARRWPMKRISWTVLFVVVACVAVSAMALAQDAESTVADSSNETAYVLRIDSLTPGEPVKFEGAVALLRGDTGFQKLDDKTPFETRLEADALSLIVHAMSDDAALSVRVMRVDGAESREVCSATGRTIISVWGTSVRESFITVWE